MAAPSLRAGSRRSAIPALAVVLGMVAFLVPWGPAGASEQGWIELPRSLLEDKIRGGLLGQILGNLNGLEHEARYLDEPGEVEGYVPALPDGARTDDDTDIEWVYVLAMEQATELRLPPGEITRLWREHLNQRIWSANQYARQLMDLGLEPPLTGHSALNPWAGFNIAGQFLCETFALVSPALPQTASELALHYVHVAVDGEPAQATQLFATMIAEAFTVSGIDALLDAGLAATDPRSRVYTIVEQVRAWHRREPEDWRAVRRLIRDAWTRHGGAKRDENGYELNTAATVAALLYGGGDFVDTLELAFALGWDADNNAAIAGTILGVVHGRRWMHEQGWEIADVYQNTTRRGLPRDETLTRFGDRLVALALRSVSLQGGESTGTLVRIPRQTPRNVEPIISRQARIDRLRLVLGEGLLTVLANRDARDLELARTAYLALALDLAPELERLHPERFRRAVAALASVPQVAQVLYHHSPVPEAEELREKAAAAGLARPTTTEPLWTQRFDLYDSAEDPNVASRPLLERLLEYRDGVRRAFAVANIDRVIVDTLRLHRLAEESARTAERVAASLRRVASSPQGSAARRAAIGELDRTLSAWLPRGRSLELEPGDSPSLAEELRWAYRELAAGEDRPAAAELATLAEAVEGTGRSLLEGAAAVRRGIELGRREPIEEGLERLAAELHRLFPGG